MYCIVTTIKMYLFVFVCEFQMGKKRWSTLEIVLLVLFLLMTVTAITIIALYVTGEPGVTSDGGEALSTHLQIDKIQLYFVGNKRKT